jgi:septal ring factor EnvC (AmiA/AmiB activator)
VVGTGAALAEEPVKACGARGDLTDLIACLRFAYGRSDAAAPQECERRPPAIVRPIEGRPVLRYGEQTSYGGLSKGLVVEGVPGALVSAPAAGFVLFAGEFRSYGTLVIIDAGCDTVVLLAGIAALTVAAGGQVDRDGPIGTMPTPPAADDLPVVYIEVRRNGAPVDPGLR